MDTDSGGAVRPAQVAVCGARVSETLLPKNGRAWRATAWTVIGALCVAAALGMSRVALSEVAWEWQLRDRFPKLEDRVTWLEDRQAERDRADQKRAEAEARMERLLLLLEAAEARERARAKLRR